ncbi:hypothetical protein [Kineosporia sp. A_224]|uniref:hypothetical protein n=1 Tax=Kineosporia sp. A_224 TaxID=1962180 RepID=UPI0018E9C143|nr:hypothetical protein [Kineosporia sp. A_224]
MPLDGTFDGALAADLDDAAAATGRTTDAVAGDAGTADAGTADAGTADAGTADAGTEDAGEAATEPSA